MTWGERGTDTTQSTANMKVHNSTGVCENIAKMKTVHFTEEETEV